MDEKTVEEYLKRHPEVIYKLLTSRELRKIGNRTFLNMGRYPELYFDGGLKMLDRLQPLRDPSMLFTDYVVTPVSYIIFGEDLDEDGYIDIVYAKNGKTGEIEFNGTDVAVIIRNAINALPTYGGKIFMREGGFLINQPIRINRHAVVLEGIGSIPPSGSGEEYNLCTKIKSVNDINLIEIGVPGQKLRGIRIEGMYLYGSGMTNGKAGIAFVGDADQPLVFYVQIQNVETGIDGGGHLVDAGHFDHISVLWCGRGMRKLGSYSKVSNSEISDNQVEYGLYDVDRVVNCTVLRNKGDGVVACKIVIGCYIGYNESNGIKSSEIAMGNKVFNNGKNGVGLANATGCIVVGNRCENNGDSGVSLWEGSTYCVVEGNRCYNNANYGVSIASGCKNNIIQNNVFHDNGLGALFLGDPDNKVKDNEGYTTENSVLSDPFPIDSIGVKTITIPHGLDITPSKEDIAISVVEETDVDDWAYNLLKIDSVDADNVVVKINVSSASATAGATARIALRIGKP